MAKPLLKDLLDYLVANKIATAEGRDIYRDSMPAAPIDVISLQEYASDPPLFFETDAVNRNIQVSVRRATTEAARAKALDIYKLLKTTDIRVQLSETRWGQVRPKQTPFKMKVDANKWVIYGFNISIATTIE